MLNANTQTTAITKDGREVILRDNGTWSYADQVKPVEAPMGEAAFRKVAWGASPEQVKSTENLEILLEDPTSVIYESTVLGLDCWVIYVFAQSKLVRAKYAIRQTHSNDNDYIADYERLKEMLIKKYGRPKKDETGWLNDLYQDDYQNWGMAIGAGHLIFYCDWDSPQTTVNLVLSGDNYEISLSVEYISKKLGHLEDQAKEQQALDEL